MTGPDADMMRKAALLRRNDSEEDEDDEPWDQRIHPRQQQQQSTMSGNGAEGDEVLDDGELPSLSKPKQQQQQQQQQSSSSTVSTPKNSASSGSVNDHDNNKSNNNNGNTIETTSGGRMVGGQITTIRPLKPASTAGTASERRISRAKPQLVEPVSSNDSTEDENVDGDVEDNSNKERGKQQRKRRSPRRYRRYDDNNHVINKEIAPPTKSDDQDDVDGPEDEIAARRANRRRRLRNAAGNSESKVDSDTDYSAQTDAESQLSDEEEEEDDSTYANTFCGQTLNAISDLCGGNLTQTASGEDQKSKKKGRKGRLSKSPESSRNTISPDSRTTLSPDSRKTKSPSPPASPNTEPSEPAPVESPPSSPSRWNKSPQPKKVLSSPKRTDDQEEHTAIEVEFVEPDPPTIDANKMTMDEKKKAYLTNMAKKARENFKQRKAQMKKPDSKVATDNKSVQSQPKIVAPECLETDESARSIPQKLHGDSDDDYNSFNAAEKRLFIKLINSGVSAADATRQVTDNRHTGATKFNDQQTREVPHDDDKTDAFSEQTPYASPIEDLGKLASVPSTDEDEDPDPENGTPTGYERNLSVPHHLSADSGNDSGRFEKSGINYYDAVRRDRDDSYMVEEEQRPTSTKSRDGDGGKTSRFFHVGKHKKFSVLKDSPEKTARSVPKEEVDASQNEGASGFHFGKLKKISALKDSPEQITRIFPQEHIGASQSEEALSSGQSHVQSIIDDLESTRADSRSNSQSQINEIKGSSSSDEIDTFFGSVPAPSKDVSDIHPIANALSSTESMEEEGLTDPLQSKKSPEENDHEENDRKENEREENGQKENGHGVNDNDKIDQDENDQEENNHDENDQERSAMTERSAATEGSTMPTSMAASESAVADKETNKAGKEKYVPKAETSMDISMDTYFSSTADTYGLTGGTMSDNVSIFTSGTAMTGTTTYTQSSRVRRPGAAKTRLAKQKEIQQKAQKKSQGWHESIKAVATKTNRVWDPKLGWVDYREPDTNPFEDNSQEKSRLRIDLDKSVISKKHNSDNQNLEDSRGSSVSVPFPDEWEKQRHEMIKQEGGPSVRPAVPNMSTRRAEQSPAKPRDGDFEERRSNELDSFAEGEQQSMDTPHDDSKPRGWIESMRAASAVLAKEGKVWDPEHGWSSKDGKVPVVSDSVDFGEPEPEPLPEDDRPIPAEDDEPIPDEDVSQESAPSKPVAELIEEEPRLLVPVPNDDELPTMEEVHDVQQNVEAENNEIEMTLPVQEESNHSVHSLNKEILTRGHIDGKAVSAPERSMTAYASDAPNFSIDEQSVENARLLGASSDFDSLGDRPRTQIVNVVKEKIGEDDMDLFTKGPQKTDHLHYQRAPDNSQSLALKPNPPLSENDLRKPIPLQSFRSAESGNSKDVSMISSRRGAGPVDVDEVDETWDSDDEKRPGRNSEPSGQRLDRSFGSTTAKTDSSVASFGSALSRKVPKLQRSKRDTSPIHGRKRQTPTHTETVPEILSDEETPLLESDDNVASDNMVQRKEDASQRNENMVFRRSRGPLTEGDQHAKKDGSQHEISRPPGSPTVRERLRAWETRIETSHSQEVEEMYNSRAKASAHEGSDGWKTFLSKKVQAESEAYANQSNAQQKQDVHKTIEDEKEDDSLFNLPEQGAEQKRALESALDISDLSPINAKEDESDYEVATSEAYGPTVEQRGASSILQRLAECAAPVMPNNSNKKESGVSGGFTPPTLCGRPDVADEKVSLAESTNSGSSHMRTPSFGDDKPRSKSTKKSAFASEPFQISTSSVVSEDFGAKTAYLDAIAMKAAVGRSRSSSRRRERSSASSIVSSSSVQSEKWKAFLEKKRSTGTSPISSRMSSSDVSRAAEKYASEKVEEIMAKMASRSKSVTRSRDVHKEIEGNEAREISRAQLSKPDDKEDSVKAAEDLAAARVEAMMAALSSLNYDEAEI